MGIMTLDIGVLEGTRRYHVESASQEPRVLVVDSPEMWDFYKEVVEGVVRPEDLLLAQYLVEGERHVKKSGPFDAYVIKPSLNQGTEVGLHSGLDLARRITDMEKNPESIWFLDKNFNFLDQAHWEKFTRLYHDLDAVVERYRSKAQFAEDFPNELRSGRRNI